MYWIQEGGIMMMFKSFEIVWNLSMWWKSVVRMVMCRIWGEPVKGIWICVSVCSGESQLYLNSDIYMFLTTKESQHLFRIMWVRKWMQNIARCNITSRAFDFCKTEFADNEALKGFPYAEERLVVGASRPSWPNCRHAIVFCYLLHLQRNNCGTNNLRNQNKWITLFDWYCGKMMGNAF
jgi:hypothetical protein